MSSYRPVTAALRVLDVLAAVNKVSHNATVAEIHRITGIDKATIVRMLTTLAHAGYVVRDKDQPVYRVTGKTLQLSAGYDRHTAIEAIVSEDLAAFRQRIGWPSDVAILDRDAMIVVTTSRQAEPLRFYRDAGFRAPVLLTSLGLAFLANCAPAVREEYLAWAAADPSPANDLARQPELLERKLEQIRKQGYATMEEVYSREFYESQFYSIGVALMAGGQTFGAINIIYLRNALTPDEARRTLLQPLQEVAAVLARKLSERSVAQA